MNQAPLHPLDPTAQLDATLRALQGGNLSALAPQAGRNLQNWVALLQSGQNPELAEVAAELQHLDEALRGSPDLGAVQQSLQTLASQTGRLAEGADAATRDKLRQLSLVLTSAVKKMNG